MKFANLVLQSPIIRSRHDLFPAAGRGQAALRHQPPPGEQLVWGNAMPTSHQAYRHTRLEGLFDHANLLRRGPAPTTLNQRDDLNAIGSIDTVVCLTLAKWETVSCQFGGYLTHPQQYFSVCGRRSRRLAFQYRLKPRFAHARTTTDRHRLARRKTCLSHIKSRFSSSRFFYRNNERTPDMALRSKPGSDFVVGGHCTIPMKAQVWPRPSSRESITLAHWPPHRRPRLVPE